MNRAVIIGETNMLIECADILLAHEWQLLYIISDDPLVIKWANNHDLPNTCYSQYQAIEVEDFTLFSIVNQKIVCKEFLSQKKVKHAINYHNSLLPRYAGLDSSTWVILNEESEHGISWHEIVEGVDEGDVYYQSSFVVDKNDTAFELNLKCTDAALIGFTQILDNLKNNKLIGKKQDLSKKTYFGKDYIPFNYGFINPADKLSYIDKVLRSLDFGPGYRNSVATAKVKVNDVYYILESQTYIDKENNIFNKLRNIYGKAVDIEVNLAQFENIHINNDEVGCLKQIKQAESRNYNRIKPFLYETELQSGLFTPNLEGTPNQRFNIVSKMSINELCMFLSIILSRFNSNKTFIKVYHGNNDITRNSFAMKIIEEIGIVVIDPVNLELKCSKLLSKIDGQLQNSKCNVIKDFAYRYQLNLCSEFAIVSNKYDIIDNHRVVFHISKDKISVEFNEKDKEFIQIIVKTIEILSIESGKVDFNNTLTKYISLLSVTDYTKIIYDWNNTDTAYPRDKLIHQLFEEQVKRTPNNVAIVFEDKKLTYKELNEKSNQLARYITKEYQNRIKEALGPDTLIALCLNRSLEMIVGILGVLKSGGAYVPIDPGYPQARINYILEDSTAKLILTQSQMSKNVNEQIYILENNENIDDITFLERKTKLRLPKEKLINIDLDNNKIYTQSKNELKENLVIPNNSSSLAYVIYTSGTTGKPKGVMVEHGSVVNYVFDSSMKNNGKMRLNSLFCAPYVFDVSIFDIWSNLIYGHTLFIIKEALLQDISSFRNYLKLNNINKLYLPAALLKLHIDSLILLKHQIKYILTGVESLESKVVTKLQNSRLKIVNAYGPTEATVCAISCVVVPECLNLYWVPIGKAMSNTKCYILDNNLQPLPLGAIGELYLSGAGLARGYLNRPELTREKFLHNQFAFKEDGVRYTRLYKTGDLCRYLNDGTVEYIGRNDKQVKINGYRIELGEIEAVLAAVPGIEQAAIIVKNKEESKYIIGYYVLERRNSLQLNSTSNAPKTNLSQEKIYKYLFEKLPEYMIPSYLMEIEEIPITINGKLDMGALPPLPEISVLSHELIAPQTYLEQKLAEIIKKHLSLSEIGVTNNIFKLGANSINAIKISHDIELLLSKKISVADIFTNNSISLMIEFLERWLSTQEIKPQFKSDFSPSYQQAGLYFIEKSSKSSVYAIPLVFKLKNNQHLLYFKAALLNLVNTNGALRTIFYETPEGVLRAKVQAQISNELNFYYTKFTNKKEIELQLAKDSYEPFDLSLSAVKYYLYESDEVFYIMMNVHHIVFDGWSISTFLNKLELLFDNYIKKKKHKDTTPDLEYSDFSEWQTNLIANKDPVFMQQFEYWQNQLSGIENLDMYKDYKPRKFDVNVYTGAILKFNLNPQMVISLKNICKKYGYSEFSLLTSAFAILLQRYSASSKNVVFGIPVSGRNNGQLREVLGYFVNSLVLRVDFTFDTNTLIEDFVALIQNIIIDAQRNMDIPFSYLVDKLNIERNGIENPIFQYMFSVQKFAKESYRNFELLDENNFYHVAKFYFNFTVNNESDVYETVVSYSKSIYTEATMLCIIESYKFILEQFIGAFEKIPVSDIQVVLPKHYQKIMSFLPHHINASQFKTVNHLLMHQGEIELPKEHLDKYLHQVFMENAIKDPTHIAITDETGNTSYGELLCHVSQLCKYINQIELSTEDKEIIAIYLPKGWKQASACLAIVASGSAYLPLNMEWPVDRIKVILKKAKAKILVCENNQNILAIKDIFGDIIRTFINMDDFDKYRRLDIPSLPHSLNKLAYVIFTSGSTGEPKGCMLSHQGVMNTIIDINYNYDIDAKCAVLALADLSFDQSVYDIFGILTAGGRIVYPIPERRKDPRHWLELCRDININVWNSVPMFLSMFIEYIQTLSDNERAYIANAFKFIMLSGEAFPLSLVRPIFDTFRSAKIVNSGGATECSIWSIWYELKEFCDEWATTPYGYAMANQRLYVLDQNFNFCPVGVIGELFIGGTGVGLGYLNNPEKTAESFIYCKKLEQNLYRTGDLVKINKNGHIDFVGRKDFQVKVNGYRIELGEIEYNLDLLPEIKLSAAIVKDSMIVAYVEVNDKIDEKMLKNKLEQVLPDYMVPKHFIVLDSLPRSTNGKVDKKDLQSRKLHDSSHSMVTNKFGPHSKFHAYIYEVWQNILSVKEFSYDNNFFEIGGNSLTAIKVISRLQKKFGIELSILDIFKYSKFSDFAQFIINEIFTRVFNNDLYSLNQIQSGTYLPSESILTSNISHSQLRILNLEHELFINNVPLHNIPVLYHFHGKVTILAIEYAINKLLQKFSVLRLSFAKNDGKYIKSYLPFMKINLITTELANNQDKDIIDFYMSFFNVFSHNYLIDFKQYKIRDDYYILAINQHHLIADGWSVQLFNQEFIFFYKEFINLGNTSLNIDISPDSSYEEYINLEHKFLSSSKLNSQLRYWIDRFKDVEIFRLDNWLLSCATSYDARHTVLELSSELSSNLENLAKSQSKSLYSLLLSCFYLSLGSLTNTNELQVFAGVSGRYTEQLEKTLGMFINGIILGAKINEDITVTELWEQVFDNCTNSYNNQAVPMDIVIEELIKSGLPNIPDIAFLMNNQNNLFSAVTDVDGLEINYEYPILPYTNFTLQTTINFINGIISINVLYKNIVPELFVTDLVAFFKRVLSNLSNKINNNDEVQINELYLLNNSYRLLPYQEIFWFSYCKEPQSSKDVICVPFVLSGVKHAEQVGSILNKLKAYFTQQHTHAFGMILEAKNGVYFVPEAETNRFFEKHVEYKEINFENISEQILPLDKGVFFKILISKKINKSYIILYIHHLIFDMRSVYNMLFTLQNIIPESINDVISRNTRYKSCIKKIENTLHEQKFRENALLCWAEILNKKNLTINYPMRFVAKYDETGYFQYFNCDFKNAKIKPTFHRLFAIYYLTLNDIVNQDEITTVYAKDLRENDYQTLSGNFVNLLPLNLKINKTESIDQIYKAIIKFMIKHKKYDLYPYLWILNDIDKNKINRENLFNVGFLETTIFSELAHIIKLEFDISYEKIYKQQMLLDFSLEYEEKPGLIMARIHYKTGLFSKEYIAKFIKTFKLFFDLYINQGNTQFCLDDFDREIVKNKKQSIPNMTKSYISALNIVTVFSRLALNFANNTALLSDGLIFKYSEVNQLSNYIAANILHKCNIGDKVILSIERSAYVPIFILGILKAGMIYVPLDKSAPENRKNYIIEDCAAKLIITDDPLRSNPFEILFTDLLVVSETQLPLVDACSAAYIIYTSGTTGKPKGTVISHQSVTTLIYSCENLFNLTAGDIWSGFHSFAFDFSIWEIFGALLTGAKLIFFDSKYLKNTDLFWEALKKHKITVLSQTPTAFKMLSLIDQQKKSKLTNLRMVIFGGEVLMGLHLVEWVKKYSVTPPRLINMYGITETTVHSTHYTITKDDINKYNIMPIGVALPHVELFLRNSDLDIITSEQYQQVGEICIAGVSVAEGYFNKPELTMERFEFIKNKRFYKSGDLAFYEDGKLFCIGRNDNQVKIRGYRIELGEINNVVANIVGVKDFVLLVNEIEGNKELVLFVQIDNVSVSEVKTQLQLRLPSYMIPGKIISILNFVYNVNGKIDKQYLISAYCNPKSDESHGAVDMQPLTSQKARQLLASWQDVLGTKHIEFDRTFFAQGGTSSSAVALTIKISKNLGVKVSLMWIFEHQTLAEQLKYFDGANLANDELYIPLRCLHKCQINSKKLFLIHPGHAGAESYYDLANYLKSYSFAVFGIESYNLYHDNWITDLTELAKKYVDIILAEQESGDFYIGGWSFGGIVAFEITRLLKALNKNVKIVFIIDSKILGGISKKNIELSIKNSINHFRATAIYEMLTANKQIYLEDLIKSELYSMYNYTINKLEVSAVVLNATSTMLEIENIELKEWRDYLPKTTEYFDIDGDHFSIMKSSDALRKIAEVIARHIE